MQCSGSRIHSHATRSPHVCGKLLFKSLHFGSKHKAGMRQDSPKHAVQLGFDLTVQPGQVYEWDSHPSSNVRRMCTGFPATTVRGGTSRVTTLPAPTIEYSPIVTPQRMVQ